MTPDPASVGQEFAQALADKDFERAGQLLASDVDFRGLTPNRAWQATGPGQVVDEILPEWFEESDQIEELASLESRSFADREHVAYSFRGKNADGPFVVEQQVYFAAENGKMTWVRVLCSGFRPSG